MTDQAFNDVKDFILRHIGSYQISPTESRVGFIVIGGDNSGKDNQYTAPSGDLNAIKTTLRQLRKNGGDRRLEETFYYLQQRLGDFRQINNKIVVTFLHGDNAKEGKAKLASAARVLYGKSLKHVHQKAFN